MLMKGGTDENLASHGKDSTKSDHAKSDVGKESLLSLFVVLMLVLVLQREEFHPPYRRLMRAGVVVVVVVVVIINVVIAFECKIFSISLANAGGASTVASEGTGTVGELQSRLRV